MGNCCPKEKKLGEVKEEETFLQSLQRRNIVQFQHKSSGSYVVPELNGEMTYLIYMDKLSNVQVYSSYFEILASGVIKHFDSDCIVASEGPSIQAGFGLALKEQLEKQDSDYSFKFTEKGLLMHQQTKLIVMPETNAIYNGSKLVVHPFSKDVDNGTIANHFEVVKVKIEVIMNEIEKKKERDLEITFQNSSDGKAAAREKLLMLQETQAPLQANTIANADFAKIQIGTNRLHISTIKNPVSNLSMNSNGMMSLTDLDLDHTETWQILPADPNKLPCADPDEIYGNDVFLKNKVGGFLCCKSDGSLCNDNTAGGDVWNILDAGEHNKFISNVKHPFALACTSSALRVVSRYDHPNESQYWKIVEK